ncbi:hypothetical protein K3N28_12295 [Glycomyces sp. TRM65418]|uniref:WXG100 family type VII secretion target n=1 Tax=Glycomyces sp. TRM65418 TaxID=2867006 RepID=UPI001CE6C4FD|nr:hypothetical protein [Glycomyces sp. TRM65418]MCC3763846.1 hypothetical protein [Glycomyces sp. TRM65418]QZD53550.1 hypothetical protein K3N28_12225 [Glycomyces sp. TRM65418]
MAGKGKDYYKGAYTHEQLWEMLHEGDDFAVERAGSIWVSAASGMKAAREELDVHVSSLRTQWTGPASDEFDSRMSIVKQYSVESEQGMQTVGEFDIPGLAAALKDAQTQSESLNPAYIDEYEDWVESTKQVDPASPEAQSKKPQWEQEYQADLDKKHDDLALIVANLGEKYAIAREEKFGEPPPPPPSDMPGNNTYTKPTGGIFSETALNSSSGSLQGANGGVTGNGANASGLVDVNGDGMTDADDLEPVDGDWNYGSYDNLDSNVSGGLASATAIPPTGGGTPSMGGTGGMGGSLAGGTGLFGPAQGAGSTAGGRGAGSTSGRGTSSSPARAGANGKPSSSPARSGAGTGRSGSGSRLSPSSRSALGRGGTGTNPRGGTRSGYHDDDEEETYTRETWLREDDVDWGRNNVRDEELDDD